MNAFLAMNGYGFYIWSSYGIAALMIVVEIVMLRAHRRAVLAHARSTPTEAASDALGAAE
jgi:heme exporter protein D